VAGLKEIGEEKSGVHKIPGSRETLKPTHKAQEHRAGRKTPLCRVRKRKKYRDAAGPKARTVRERGKN